MFMGSEGAANMPKAQVAVFSVPSSSSCRMVALTVAKSPIVSILLVFVLATSPTSASRKTDHIERSQEQQEPPVRPLANPTIAVPNPASFHAQSDAILSALTQAKGANTNREALILRTKNVLQGSGLLQWVHFPKAGTSFGSFLVATRCPTLFKAMNISQLPFGFDDRFFREDYTDQIPQSQREAATRCRSKFGRWGLHDPVRDKAPIATMFRDPYDRIVSGYFHRLHGCNKLKRITGVKKMKKGVPRKLTRWQNLYFDQTLVMNNSAFLDWVRDNYARGNASIVEYAKCVAGCQTKMLGGFGKCESPKLKPGDIDHALKVLDEQVIFGGINERWQEAADLLYSLSGQTLPAPVVHVRQSVFRDEGLKTAVRAALVLGFRDADDEVLYARARDRFEVLLQASRTSRGVKVEDVKRAEEEEETAPAGLRAAGGAQQAAVGVELQVAMRGAMPSIETLVSTKVRKGTVHLRSFFGAWLAFWPPLFGPVQIILDDAAAAQRLSACFANKCGAPAVKHVEALSQRWTDPNCSQTTGCSRSGANIAKTAWKFVADQTSQADVVAFFDDDACLQDHLIPDDLFAPDGRIIARGMNATGPEAATFKAYSKGWFLHSKWFGLAVSDVSYMVEFPVLVWRAMLPDFRAHVNGFVLGQHNNSSVALFLEAYARMHERHHIHVVCEYCLLLNFAAASPKWRVRYRFDTWPQTSPMLVHAVHHFSACPRPKALWERTAAEEAAFVSHSRARGSFPVDSNEFWWEDRDKQVFKTAATQRALAAMLEERAVRVREFVGRHRRSELSWYELCQDRVDARWEQCVFGGSGNRVRWYGQNPRGQPQNQTHATQAKQAEKGGPGNWTRRTRSQVPGPVEQRARVQVQAQVQVGLAPSPRPLCFIHVGKAGGQSVVKALLRLMSLGEVQDLFQIHTNHARSTRQLRVRSPSQSTGAQSSVNFFNYGGPVSPLSVSSMGGARCAQTGRVLLWVRDPVSRMISTWNFQDAFASPDAVRAARSWNLVRDNETAVDLESMLTRLASKEKAEDPETGFEQLYSVLRCTVDSHALLDLVFYLGDMPESPGSQVHRLEREIPKTWANKSKGCQAILDQLPVYFVGRTEHEDRDWTTFSHKITGGRVSYPVPHTHKTNRQQKPLSVASVRYLRRFYSADYACLKSMVDKGWLSTEYWDSITSPDNVYLY